MKTNNFIFQCPIYLLANIEETNRTGEMMLMGYLFIDISFKDTLLKQYSKD